MGFHLVHDIYIELVKLGYDLRELYDYSCKELLFILKYRREGVAYDLWRQGSMTRAAFHSKKYPDKLEEAIPEMFEKQTVQIEQLPDEIKIIYAKQLQNQINQQYKGGDI